ncbi:hypothetical protein K469DRAFT_306418 [Zopfia rhizophila CBS 207.26]|uniref:Uncharacterized protein n=1 Tax=Zopfia rhizophila CBS 207.26 TaxID=1314779 RepID=A0A6A6EN65_9PEZI|nr:hypothetical protein K469DRAFT_306418 [Zopfia rhizophila CBS 207.26]
MISNFHEPSRCLAQLLLWPKKLEHFPFTIFYAQKSCWYGWDLLMFGSLLGPHRISLKTLTIRLLVPEGKKT